MKEMRKSATTSGGLLTGRRVAVAAAFVIVSGAAWLVPPSLLETLLARITSTTATQTVPSESESRFSRDVRKRLTRPRRRLSLRVRAEAAVPAFAADESAGHLGCRSRGARRDRRHPRRPGWLGKSGSNGSLAKEADDLVEPLALGAHEVPSSTPSRIYSALDADVTPPSLFRAQRLGALTRGTGTHDEATIEVVIDASGAVETVRVSQSPRTLAESLLLTTALHAVKSWQFKPAVKDSTPVRLPAG